MTQLEKINDIIQDTDKNYLPYYGVIPELIKQRGYKKVIEIGVFCGGHAAKILKTDIDLLVGVDPYQHYDPGMPRLDNQSDFDLLYSNVMDRLQCGKYLHLRENSDKAFDLLKDQLFDVVFIDGLHTYEQLTKDLENYEKIIKKGGIISCHDYNHPYFPRLTNAIDEFVKKRNAKLVIGPLHLVYFEKTW